MRRGSIAVEVPGPQPPQKTTEDILMKEAVAHGVQFRWDAPVAGLLTSPNGTTIVLASGEQLAAPYVIGADEPLRRATRESG